jgi:hypothetical protein
MRRLLSRHNCFQKLCKIRWSIPDLSEIIIDHILQSMNGTIRLHILCHLGWANEWPSSTPLHLPSAHNTKTSTTYWNTFLTQSFCFQLGSLVYTLLPLNWLLCLHDLMRRTSSIEDSYPGTIALKIVQSQVIRPWLIWNSYWPLFHSMTEHCPAPPPLPFGISQWGTWFKISAPALCSPNGQQCIHKLWISRDP